MQDNGFDSARSLDQTFSKAVHLYRQRSRELLHDLGLHRGQPRILYLLWKTDGMKQKEIAEALQLQPATVTRMLQRMDKSGFVEKRQDQIDMRVSRIHLTKQGRDIRSKVRGITSRLQDEAFEGFSETEMVLMYRFLQQMNENLEKIID
jgi:DNA-binding MarR family transcriptional regulator